MKIRFLVTVLSVLVLCWPKTAAAQCSTYGGRATVVQASGRGIVPVVLSDTGNIDSTGGINDASFLNASVPSLLSGEVLSATAAGDGNFSHSVASLANLNLTVAGNRIGADFAVAHANASCASGVPAASGRTEIDGLVVNGLSIFVTGSPNQIVSLLGGGYLILNEQTSSGNGHRITVNALHVRVPGFTDVIIDSASAAISGQLVGDSGGRHIILALLLQAAGVNCQDIPGHFFTGGGWINTTATISSTTYPSAKKTFGVSGGFRRNETPFGHLEYVDHGTPMINAHGTGVTSCSVVFSNMGQIRTGTIVGTATVNGQGGCTHTVTVIDDDTQGGIDTFGITLKQDSMSTDTCQFTTYSAAGPLGGDGPGGGNIEFH